MTQITILVLMAVEAEAEQRPVKPSTAQAVSHVAPTHATTLEKARPVAPTATTARADRPALPQSESAATRYVLAHF